MTGYIQIPVKKLEIKGKTLYFSISDEKYSFTSSSPELINLIKKGGDKISKMLIGFMIKDGKITGHEDLGIVRKNINAILPDVLLSESKKTKILRDSSSKKEVVRNIRNNSQDKRIEKVPRFKKISHRFRKVTVPLGKIKFGNDEISFSYGMSKFVLPVQGVLAEFNDAKFKSKLSIIKMDFKLNEDTVILENPLKDSLLSQLYLIKNKVEKDYKIRLVTKYAGRYKGVTIPVKILNFDSNGFSFKYENLEYSVQADGSIPEFNEQSVKNLISFKNIQAKVNGEHAEIEEKVKNSLIKHFTTARNKIIKQNSNNINENPIEIIKSLEWNLIRFFDGYLTYSGKRFIHPRAKSYLNHLKFICINKQFYYHVVMKKNFVEDVKIPDEVYRLAKLGKKVDDILNIRHTGKNFDLKFTLKEFGLSFNDVLKLFNKRKSFYLEYLGLNRLDKFDIIVIPEPIFQKETLVRRDISFVFYLGNLDCPLIVWESVEINKASYVFKIDCKNYGIEKYSSPQS